MIECAAGTVGGKSVSGAILEFGSETVVAIQVKPDELAAVAEALVHHTRQGVSMAEWSFDLNQ